MSDKDTVTINELRAKLEQAEAKCVEGDNGWFECAQILATERGVHHEVLAKCGELRAMINHIITYPQDLYKARALVVKENVGFGWASPEKVKELEAMVNRMADGHKNNLAWIESAEGLYPESVVISAVRFNCEQALTETEAK